MNKIAIVVTGQIRGHDEIQEQWISSIRDLFSEYSFDLYGHTWLDEKTPSIVSEFVDFKKTDKNDIWEHFGKFDVFGRVPYREFWFYENEDFKKVFNGESSFKEFCKRYVINTYAQIWSFSEGLKLVPRIEYDLIVKYRWDLFADSGMEIQTHNLVSFKEALRSFIETNREFDNGFVCPDVLTASPMFINRSSMDDTIFLMKPNNSSMGNITTETPSYWLERTLLSMPRDKKIHSHELWYHYLDSAGFKIAAGFPNQLFRVYRGGEFYKETF